MGLYAFCRPGDERGATDRVNLCDTQAESDVTKDSRIRHPESGQYEARARSCGETRPEVMPKYIEG